MLCEEFYPWNWFKIWNWGTSLVAQTVKNLPAMQETQVWSLGSKDPLEREMITHSSILAWRIPWTQEPGRLQSIWLWRVGHDWATNNIFCTHFKDIVWLQSLVSNRLLQLLPTVPWPGFYSAWSKQHLAAGSFLRNPWAAFPGTL